MTILTVADLSAKLVELESHPGLEHVRRYPPTGVTALRWAPIDVALGRLWENLAELQELTDAGEVADALKRINRSYPEVEDFLDLVDAINTKIAEALGPSLRLIDDTGAAVPKDVTDLLAVSASDPISLTNEQIDMRIAAIVELVALQVNWPDAISVTCAALDTLREAVKHAAATRERATRTVLTGPLPVAAAAEPEFRAELESLTSPDPVALRGLQRRIESALQRVRHDEALAQGLLDRRSELGGRLRAYAAKATRLGLADDPELSSSRGVASGLLKRRPCDLRAVTQAIVDYQRLVSAKREQTR